MFKLFERLWRLIATAISFVVFGLGGLIISLVLAPVIYVVSPNQSIWHRRGKALLHYAFRLFLQILKWLGVLTFEVHGLEKLSKAQLVLANHPTLIDVIFLMAMVPNASCIVKSSLSRNLFTGSPVKSAGYIINDDSARVMTDAAAAAFSNGEALIVFPEGTRSKPDTPLTLKRGAAYIAVKTQADVTLVLIRCEPVTLVKGQAWYKVPTTRPHFTISVTGEFPTDSFVAMEKPSVAARQMTLALTNYFNKEIGLSERSTY